MFKQILYCYLFINLVLIKTVLVLNTNISDNQLTTILGHVTGLQVETTVATTEVTDTIVAQTTENNKLTSLINEEEFFKETTQLNIDRVLINNNNNNDNKDDINQINNNNNNNNNKKQIPPTCAAYKLLLEQPKINIKDGRLKKCCPFNESYIYQKNTKKCIPMHTDDDKELFNPTIIKAKFYENCIEDEEVNDFVLDYEIGNPCKSGYLVNKNYDDLLYIIQNGSLLRISSDFSTYDVHNDYCIDYEIGEKVITALICHDFIYNETDIVHVSRTQMYIVATCMLISVPCLLLTSIIYIFVDELNTQQGKMLSWLCFCLMIGFGLLAIDQFRSEQSNALGYIVQFFILASFVALLTIIIDLFINIWYHLPPGRHCYLYIKFNENQRLLIYFIITLVIPVIFLIIALANKIPGTPSYYLRGVTEGTRQSQRIFIPFVTLILFISFIFFIGVYYAIKNLNRINVEYFVANKTTGNYEYVEDKHKLMQLKFENMKRMSKSILYLYIVMSINWAFEIISFFLFKQEGALLIFDIINGLQGIIIFLIFICLPYPVQRLRHYWSDSGSIDLKTTEMETILPGTNNRKLIYEKEDINEKLQQ